LHDGLFLFYIEDCTIPFSVFYICDLHDLEFRIFMYGVSDFILLQVLRCRIHGFSWLQSGSEFHKAVQIRQNQDGKLWLLYKNHKKVNIVLYETIITLPFEEGKCYNNAMSWAVRPFF